MANVKNIFKGIGSAIGAVANGIITANYGNQSVEELINSLTWVNIGMMDHLSYISSYFRRRLLSFNAGDYIERFASNLPVEYGTNRTTTTLTTTNQSQNSTSNVYWNESNSTGDGVYDYDSYALGPDSILYKTKQLFNSHQISTIVSRFHTEGDTDYFHNFGNGTSSKYGMSHGRNLLTKDADNDKGGVTYPGGYENPYCRVWTYFHQYDRISRYIRPFSDESGKPISVGTLQNDWKFIRGNEGAKLLNENTVINKNGYVNIAPMYDAQEEEKVHTKQCMFSIENLAWKGVSPYDFEKNLSWEQRGPFGGRIMWFPPYDISFSESTTVNWNADGFIGRGEKVYTYVDTDRSGTLHFKMVVDHPAIINYFNQVENTVNTEGDTDGSTSDITSNDLHRFFAGCDPLTGSGKAKPLTDETIPVPIVDIEVDDVDIELPEPVFTEEEPAEEKSFVFYVYYPNNYSGVDDPPGSPVEAMAYLLNGTVTQKNDEGSDEILQFSDLRNHMIDNGVGNGFEMSLNDGVSHDWEAHPEWGFMEGKYMDWKYRVDRSTIDQRLTRKINEIDLDASVSGSKNGLNIDASLGGYGADYSFAEVAYALSGIDLIKQKAGGVSGFNEHVNSIKEILSSGKITKVESHGLANSHGNNASESVNDNRNQELARNRGQSVINWLSKLKPFSEVGADNMIADIYTVEQVTNQNVSDINSKRLRAARVTVYYKTEETKAVSDTTQSKENTNSTTFQEDKIVYTGSDGMYEYGEYIDGDKALYFKRIPGKSWETDESKGGYAWTNMMNDFEVVAPKKKTQNEIDTSGKNTYRYDQEYHFFQVLRDKAPHTFKEFTEKIKYFTPAFHSMTPEGFNGRLNFLQQCTRQGNTMGASDKGGNQATNLAFGRPPICILRLGDFYYTRIVITSLNVTYDPLVWDLNSEGIGLQPLIANVDISFNFIGGSDITGPIERLQNAMTFNYYANTRVYDNRADGWTYNGGNPLEGGEYKAYYPTVDSNN